tara:strand:- start:78 stop:497 length:420 start_codon:yes stop_codon:yes gene_type:complete
LAVYREENMKYPPEEVEWVRETSSLKDDPEPANRKNISKEFIRGVSFKARSIPAFEEPVHSCDLYGMLGYIFKYSLNRFYLYVSQCIGMTYREILKDYYELVDYENKQEAIKEEKEKVKRVRKILTMDRLPLFEAGGEQ